MAENATPSKIAATRGYGAEVVLHGDDLGRSEREGEGAGAGPRAHLHPSVRRSRSSSPGRARSASRSSEDWPDVDVVVVPIGGGGLISGVAMAVKNLKPSRSRIIGVESSGAPGMRDSVRRGTS